jgi:Xaa-Pro aminopeptidase
MFDKKIYSERRDKLRASVKNGIILLPGNEETGMNYKDNIYHFRQDSTFLYFTGIDRPALFLIINIDNDQEILFGNDLTVEEMVWTGPQQKLTEFAAKAGIKNVHSVSGIATVLKNAVQQKQTVHFIAPYRAEIALQLSEWLSIPCGQLQQHSSASLINAAITQRSYKSVEEINEIEKAVDITAAMHLKAIQFSQVGMKEFEVAAQLECIAAANGGSLAFPIILTVKGQYLHNHAGGNILQSRQMVLCDCGAENPMHYAGDMTRTFPVDKKFTQQQKEVYTIVLNAHESAIAALRPGIPFRDVHLIACEKLTEGLKQLGLIKGDAKEAVQAGVHTLFFQCGLGHMMGLDVHDMENLGEENVGYNKIITKSKAFGFKSLRLGKELEEGFVLTIEPGIYIIPELIDQWRAEKKLIDFINYEKINSMFRDFGGIRVEEDFIITAAGSRLLGKPLAKTIAAIEAVRAG